MKAENKSNSTKKILIGAVVNMEHNYHAYGTGKSDTIIFNFKPGQHWKFCDEYPGNPGKFEIHKTLFYELKSIRILKGAYKNG